MSCFKHTVLLWAQSADRADYRTRCSTSTSGIFFPLVPLLLWFLMLRPFDLIIRSSKKCLDYIYRTTLQSSSSDNVKGWRRATVPAAVAERSPCVRERIRRPTLWPFFTFWEIPPNFNSAKTWDVWFFKRMEYDLKQWGCQEEDVRDGWGWHISHGVDQMDGRPARCFPVAFFS